MALTGILLLVFVIAHLLGNLQIFAGPDAINSYSEKLRELGPLLWTARIGLIVIAVAHVATALRLMRANEAARPVAYVKLATRQVRRSTRFMATSGLVLLGYVLLHLAHFTWGWVQGDHFRLEETFSDGSRRRDVYAMMVLGFRTWWMSAIYLVAMFFLFLHLWHGVPSFFQTIGVNHPKYDAALRALGPLLSGLILIGYASIPIAVLAGWVTLAEAAP